MFEAFITRLNHVEVLRIQPEDTIREDLGTLATRFFLCGVIPDGREIKLPKKIYTSKDTHLKPVNIEDFIDAIVVLTDKSCDVIKCDLYEARYFSELYVPNQRENWQMDQFEDDHTKEGFEWAMVHLKEGRDVCRVAWGGGENDASVFVTVKKAHNGAIIEPIELHLVDGELTQESWIPSADDLAANDWRVIWRTLEDPDNDNSR